MYTMQRCLVVMIGAALASIAGAQSMPYQPPPDASSYQGPAPEAPPAYANTAPAQNDPPGRVARLSYVNGEVSFTPAGEDDWVQAQVNRPVVTGDKIWTNDDAHAELSLGAATVRLDRSSSFDFLNLDDQLAQMELTQGTLNLNVRRLRGNETYEVDTPTIAFVASRDGDYRINVDPNGGTTVTAWRGSGDAVGEGGRRVTIEEGQAVVFTDSQLSNPQVSQIGARNQAAPGNGFDTFVSEREQRYTQASHQYVSEDVVGYEDLDQYGTWEDAPQYGHVWYPREVAADWAPYHDGHWAWVDPWGWTWVDNAPWGYAPSHYGRWSYVGSRWGWVPGPVNVAPVYAPAFVAFVGGGGVSVGFSVGGPVGWFALGPSDVYFPGYRCGRDYFARINYGSAYVSHTVVNNYYGGWSNGSLNYSQMHYANRDAPRAMTAMRGDAFVAGRPVAGAAIAVNRETFANARVAPRANLMPTRESLVAGRSRAAAPPAAAINRPVIAANRPAPAAPSFEQRQALLQRNGGQPLTRNQMRTAAAQQPANTRVAAANSNVRVVGNNNRGNAVTARAAADAGANRGNTAGATAETNARANNGRVAGQTPSRATEMNRSPDHANAQYQRSAGFAHQGVVPGSERATNAQQGRANGAATREAAQAREAQSREARNMPQQNRSEQANRAVNTPQNAQRLNSSTFAHGNQNARGSGSSTQQREEANARSNAQQREHTATANAARENAQARSNATAQQNARDQQSARDRNSRAQANADASARAEANSRASANARAETNARGSTNARAAESARQSQMAQSRAQEQQRAAAAEQQSRASSQARAQQQQRAQQENRAVAQERAHAQQQQQQQQREAQIQRSQQQQQRAQPQVAHSPPQQRSEPVTRSQPQQQVQRAPVQRSEPAPQPQVAHAPPPQQQQRAQPQQHQVARSTPQQHQPAPKKEKDKDNPGGG